VADRRPSWKGVAMRTRVAWIAALSFMAAGCASGTVSSLSAVVPSTSISSASAAPSSSASDVCIDPNPAVPAPVTPAIPAANGAGGMASAWSLDGGQAVVAPAGDAHPAVDRQQALCTLLAAHDISHFSVLDGDFGFSLVLAKVTIADQLVESPEDAGDEVGVQSPPPLTPFHSRLAWVAVINDPVMSTCGSDGFASPPPSRPLVPYQLLVLDADTGDSGVVYQARTYSPCTGSPAFGPEVSTLTVTASVPWRLISRDPGGLFGTIAVTTTSCDSFAIGANTSGVHVGELEFDVWRPLADCGAPRESEQTLRGPTVSDPLPPTLTHAPLGYRDVAADTEPDPSLDPAALLCEQSVPRGQVVAAYLPTTIGELLLAREGPPPGYPLVNSAANKFPASAQAAWCEVKSASGYAIDIVGPDGAHISGDIDTSTTFIDLKNGPPTVP
jgi:hypothetical protein